MANVAEKGSQELMSRQISKEGLIESTMRDLAEEYVVDFCAPEDGRHVMVIEKAKHQDFLHLNKRQVEVLILELGEFLEQMT